MGLRIQNNIEAFNTHRQLTATAAQASKSMEKLSSGYRINRAADDSAGLAISEKLRAEIGGLDQAQRNSQDAVSLVQTAEGAMSEVHAMLQRVRELAVQYNNGTLSASDKASITAEVSQLCAEISRIGSDTKFNGIAVLTGSSSITFQVGAQDGETISVATISDSGTVLMTWPFTKIWPLPLPEATPRSASRASPGPLTTQPMTATRSGTLMPSSPVVTFSASE